MKERRKKPRISWIDFQIRESINSLDFYINAIAHVHQIQLRGDVQSIRRSLGQRFRWIS